MHTVQGTSLLQTFWHPEFLATFCCNIDFKMFNQTCWDQNFVPIMEVFSIVSGSLLRTVPLYTFNYSDMLSEYDDLLVSIKLSNLNHLLHFNVVHSQQINLSLHCWNYQHTLEKYVLHIMHVFSQIKFTVCMSLYHKQ